MKINFLSDLHLEGNNPANNLLSKPYVPTGDVVLLSGDITNSTSMERVKEYFENCGKEVLYIPGNHEYYGGNWDTQVDTMCKYYAENCPNIKVMDDDYVKIGDVHFLGGTFWSNISPLEEGEVKRCIADFVWYARNKFERPIQVIDGCTIDKQRQAHKLSYEWFDLMLGNIRRKDPEAKIVCFTHFPPSWEAQEARFKSTALGSYFYSHSDYLIEKHQPNYWIYGHTHGNISWKNGITNILSNQLGYRSEPSNSSFDQHMEIEL